MNNKILALAVAILGGLFTTLDSAVAQNTQFTYQGMLNTNGAPYSGSAEFEFTLWDAAASGNPIATNNPTSIITNVANGLFTVTLDFGSVPFSGDPRFLEISVRTVIGPFTTLTPRQPLTATPYALRALNLTTNGLQSGTYTSVLNLNNSGNIFAGAFSGTVTGTFTGTLAGDGTAVSNVNAVTLGGANASAFWKTNGNAGANPTNGAFLGTTDNLPLELKVAGHRAIRLEPDSSGSSPNVILGSDANSIRANVFGSAIGGGEENNIFLSAGQPQERDSVIAGGANNIIGSISSGSAVLFGGFNVIGGGFNNNIRANADFNVISGGENNIVATNAQYAIIPGGDNNTATNHAFAAGHRAKANYDGSFVWADSTEADFASTATNQFLIRASGGVGIGTPSPSRELEVQSPGDTEIGIKSTDAGGHLWTLQSSGTNANANLSTSFQIIDRTSGGSRLLIGTNGEVGIGTTSPGATLDVRGNLKLGASSELFGAGGVENLRILRGRITGSTGAIDEGSGFSVLRTAAGSYTITFSNAFTAFPSITVTPLTSGLLRFATLDGFNTTTANIKTWNTNSTAIDSDFTFIAAGPR